MNSLRIKDISLVKESSNSGLKKTLGAMDLILLGIGAVVGTGVFVLTGAASQYAGPALVLSFLLSGFACLFVALVYTEIASMIPTSGSVYSYSYVALGEFAAWMTSWFIILEFAVGSTTVAAGWSGYFVDILKQTGIMLPHSLTSTPSEGGIINLPAVFIALFVTSILVRGTKESAMLNNILVAVKIGAIFLFLAVAAPNFELRHWENFAPNGFAGISTGAAVVFLAFIGFDSLATAAEECKNPKRDITIGIIASLVICTILYALIAAGLTGIVDYKELNNAKPLAYALGAIGKGKIAAIVAASAVAGMTTVILVQIYAQSRIFLAMARDGLLPKAFGKLHPKFGTPYISTIVIGSLVAIVSGLVPISILGNMANMGTLSVFIIASIVVMVLRKTAPDMERPFKCPLIHLVGAIAIISCGYLFLQLMPLVGKYYLIWSCLGVVIYFIYGYRASNMNKANLNSL
ncbi:MAG: amino acid permease [Alphaproteobacteria bacterium]